MAVRKTTKTRWKRHYSRGKRRGNGAGSAVVVQRVFVVVAALLILAGALYGVGLGIRALGRLLFSENPRFAIQNLVINGTENMTERMVREATGLSQGDNLFSVSFSRIKEELEGYAVVESVELQRELPSTLYVRVKERVPVARISIARYSQPCPLDRFGYVLSPRKSPELEQLPLITGLEEDARAGDCVADQDIDIGYALKIIALCDSKTQLHDHIKIRSMDIKHNDYIDIVLVGGTHVRMPRRQLERKLGDLATTISMSGERSTMPRLIDLTLDTGKITVLY